MRTDAELLNGLQARLGKYTGKVICRWSEYGRGWRLHETGDKGAHNDVRQAIDTFLDENRRRSYKNPIKKGNQR